MWKALELSTSGMTLPQALASAMDKAKTAYFEPSYLALRDRLADALVKGEKAEMTANQWSPVTVGRMASAVAVAETALEAAKTHTLEQRSAAQRALIVQLLLLVLAVGVAVGAITLVTRRVINPLHNIRDAMLKVAGGDLSVDSGYLDRKDEIGALAGALETFKQQATDKLTIDAIQAIGGIIGEVNEVATAIAAAVQEQGAATQEITRSTQYAAQGTKNVSENITGVKADADTAAAAAENVKLASETLETQSRQLGHQVSDFLGKIRAA
jgi:methyl-accepting chemotaxis protein